PTAATVFRSSRKPHWSCGQRGRAENWAYRIQCLRGCQAPAAIVSRARRQHKEAEGGDGSGGRRGVPRRPAGGAAPGIPKELAARMQAIEQRLAPPDAEWPNPRGPPSWHAGAGARAGAGGSEIKKSPSTKTGECIGELEETFEKFPFQLTNATGTSEDVQRALSSLEKMEKELLEKQSQFVELSEGTEHRKEAIEAKKLDIAALDTASTESARSVTGATAAAADGFNLEEADVADQPEFVAFINSEAWAKHKSALSAKYAARAGAASSSDGADWVAAAEDPADMPMAAPFDEQKKHPVHAREPGGIDAFTQAFDATRSEVAAKRARHQASVNKRLTSTAASVVLFQEFGHISDHVEAMGPWCAGRGRRLMALPSTPAAGTVPPAGAAVAVRDSLSARPPAHGERELTPSRVQRVAIDPRGLRSGLHLFNVYLVTGGGAVLHNDSLPQELGSAAAALDGPAIVGGDWAMPPEASQFPAHVGCSTVNTSANTFIGDTGNSAMDYFLLNSAAMRTHASISIDAKRSKRGHRPVRIPLKGGAEHVKKPVYTVAPRMGAQVTAGPSPPPPPRRGARRAAEAAAAACADERVPPSVGWGLLSAAWGQSAALAAESIAAAAGHQDCTAQVFARPLRPRWIDISYTITDQSDLQAVSEGWQRGQHSLLHLAALKRAPNPSAQELAQRAEEALTISTAAPHGRGLSARLERSAQQARALEQGGFDEEARREFLGGIEPAAKPARNGAPTEGHQKR
ncbi:unnamed protein product, partial [Prorocentrum cordatum]